MTNAKTKNIKKSTTAQSALRRRQERRKNRGGTATADWQGVDNDLLITLVSCITALGGTITFGYTKDGGAYFIQYYVDGQSIKEYCRPTEDIDKFLEDELISWNDD